MRFKVRFPFSDILGEGCVKCWGRRSPSAGGEAGTKFLGGSVGVTAGGVCEARGAREGAAGGGGGVGGRQ